MTADTIEDVPTLDTAEKVVSENNHYYEVTPDRTLPLAKSKYPTRFDAKRRFDEIQAKYNYVLVDTAETENHWVFFVLDKIERSE